MKVGTRKSKLALAQTEQVIEQLRRKHSGETFEMETFETTGDVALNKSFAAIGGKGIFVKELDEALLSNRVDFVVHSLKDLPSDLEPGVNLAAVCLVVDSRDAFISRNGKNLGAIEKNTSVGTSSVRRTALLKKIRPDIRPVPLRGNLDTRLRKLDDGEVDAIVVAAAGLERLGLSNRVTERLDPIRFVPAVGQGMLAVTVRDQDRRSLKMAGSINDETAFLIAKAQRVFMARMEGGCQIPLGCFGREDRGELALVGFLADLSGDREIYKVVKGSMNEADQVAKDLADSMLKDGGRDIIRNLRAATSDG